MTIGSGIGLIILGAILAFGIEADAISGINLQFIGYILMAGGAVGLIIGIGLMSRRAGPRRTSRTEVVEQNQTPNGTETVRRSDNVID
ncbi:DUF6458 family protein [Aquipuribacter sp. MA13-6]|uniref:DUF6458 family protein n=1 Tax=unclassified Aquipuribacter TaxID=2635084 RepID=UPI003EEE6BA9